MKTFQTIPQRLHAICLRAQSGKPHGYKPAPLRAGGAAPHDLKDLSAALAQRRG